jgi:Ca2+:H+ antiporter
VLAAVLLGNVVAAVHHAEVVALRVGEPYGILVLALAVTVIEVGLIISIMLSGEPPAPTRLHTQLARTALGIIFSTAIITTLLGWWFIAR